MNGEQKDTRANALQVRAFDPGDFLSTVHCLLLTIIQSLP